MNTVDSQKQLAAQLADLLYQNENLPAEAGVLAEKLGIRAPLGAAGALGAAGVAAAAGVAGAAGTAAAGAVVGASDAIGIWNREGDVYTRSLEARMDWWLWAKNHEFPAVPEAGRKRVVLLGESVARGYLYDPFYTVAQELEAQLNSAATGGLQAEVIDLARTDLGLPMLHQLLADSAQLKPDAVVIFAGNNWLHTMKDAIGADDYQELARFLQKGDLAGVRSLLEERLATLVAGFLEFAAGFSREKGIPVVFVIPEFNLKDWSSNALEKNITGLSPEKLSEWLALRERGNKALRLEDHIVLDAIASGMIELDETHPLGYEWKAASAIYFGRNEEARGLLEKARDTAIFGRAETKPRCFAVARRVISELAPGLGIGVVDLPAVYKRELRGELPGRQIFLDYCHLTMLGIRLAMKHTAAAVAGLLSGREVGADGFGESGLGVDGEALAVAHMAAAVHNAHYGQPYGILLHHCIEAARASAIAEMFMREFVDFSSRKVSNTICAAHEKVVESGVFTQYEGGLGFVHSRRSKLLDVPLVSAMLKVLDDEGLQRRVDDLRVAEHAVLGGRTVDLLESYYSSVSYDVFNSELPVLNYYQGRNNVSPFVFLSDGATPLQATLVCRVPGAVMEQEVRLLLNGEVVGRFVAGGEWTTVKVDVGGVGKGLQTLTVGWPFLDERATPGGLTPKVSTPADFLNRMYPVWGEIFSFQLSEPVKVIAQESLEVEMAVAVAVA